MGCTWRHSLWTLGQVFFSARLEPLGVLLESPQRLIVQARNDALLDDHFGLAPLDFGHSIDSCASNVVREAIVVNQLEVLKGGDDNFVHNPRTHLRVWDILVR